MTARAASSTPLPGPRGVPLLGVAPAMKRDSLGFIAEVQRRHGDVAALPLPGLRGVLVHDPDLIELVLTETEHRTEKGKLYDAVKTVYGEGLVTSSGALWKRQRRIAAAVFAPKRLAGFHDIIVDATARLAERWRALASGAAAPPGVTGPPRPAAAGAGDDNDDAADADGAAGVTGGATIDVLADLKRLVFEITMRSMFSLHPGRSGATGERDDRDDRYRDLLEHIGTFQEYVTHLFWRAIPLPPWMPTPLHRRFATAKRRFDGLIHEMIARRRAAAAPPAERDDLLGLLINARDPETGEQMVDRQVRDEIVTSLVAGYETTAIALAFTLHLLALHAPWQRRLAAEATTRLADRSPTPDDVEHLELSRLAFHEGMRLYPPVWMLNRTSTAPLEAEVGGRHHRFAAGTTFFLPQYTVHRDPRLWPDPERFDPERFTAERSRGRHRFAYFPFGGGPRVCIGARLAVMEAQLILSMLLRHVELSPAAGAHHRLVPLVTLSPEPGIQLRLTPRLRPPATSLEVPSIDLATPTSGATVATTAGSLPSPAPPPSLSPSPAPPPLASTTPPASSRPS